MAEDTTEGVRAPRRSVVTLDVDVGDVDGQEQAEEALEGSDAVVNAALPTPRRSTVVLDVDIVDKVDILATADVRSSGGSTAEASSECDAIDVPAQTTRCGVKTDETAIILKFRRRAIAVRCAIGAVWLFIWCLVLLLHKPVLKRVSVDLEEWNSDEFVQKENIESALSSVRNALPMLLKSLLEPVVAMLVIDTQLQVNPDAFGTSLRTWSRTALVYALTYPLTSIDTKERKSQTPMIARRDLFDDEAISKWVNGSSSAPVSVVDNGSFVTTDITNTMLADIVKTSQLVIPSCPIREDQVSNPHTGVAFGFLANEWNSQSYRMEARPPVSTWSQAPVESRTPRKRTPRRTQFTSLGSRGCSFVLCTSTFTEAWVFTKVWMWTSSSNTGETSLPTLVRHPPRNRESNPAFGRLRAHVFQHVLGHWVVHSSSQRIGDRCRGGNFYHLEQHFVYHCEPGHSTRQRGLAS